MKPGHLTSISRGKKAGPEQRDEGRDMFRGGELPLGRGKGRGREAKAEAERQRGGGKEAEAG